MVRAETAGDVAARLGVPASRIVLRPVPGTATREDWVRCVETKSPLCELVDGTLVEIAMGAEEDAWRAELIGLFFAANGRLRSLRKLSHPPFYLLGSQGMVDVGTSGRIPDVSLVRWSDWDRSKRTATAPVPVLAVEILSKTNTPAEIDRKRNELFAAGLTEMWVVEPNSRRVEIWATATAMTLVPSDAAIDASVCFPGLQIPIATWLDFDLSSDVSTLLEPMTA